MIQHLFSVKMKRRRQAPRKKPTGSTLHVEFLEARYVLAGAPPIILENWQSAIFDDGVSGTLPFQFSRNTQTVDTDGTVVPASTPRFGEEQLLTEIGSWTPVQTLTANARVFGSGWDHDGQTPLAVYWDVTARQLTFIRGNDFTIANTVSLPGNLDLFGGQVQGYRYLPEAGVVYEGLVVVMLRRDRLEGSNWVSEGVAFAFTQDYGQSFQRVEQVGGGYDVPALAGGVADGMNRTREWAFSNAFPEKSADDLLGAWFPWADYLDKTDGPKGGQIGVFRARRSAVGELWTVEANRLVYEDWREEDSGGLHAHTAGMFVDGMVSFWGDVNYRNRMVRHIADDLENYTTSAWTHEEEFHGGWSPSANPIPQFGNQALSAAPGPNFGEVLVVGDEQPELIMKIERPDNLSEKAIITSLRGSFPGTFSGAGYTGRFSPYMQRLRGVGYIVTEQSTNVVGTAAVFYSPDGVNWAQLLDSSGIKMLFGKSIVTGSGGMLYAIPVPEDTSAASPLLLNPGGRNLATADPVQVAAATSGNTARRVLYENGIYIYQDTLEPLDVQPAGPPPVVNSMPMWEFASAGTSTRMGIWELGNISSPSNQLHWLSTWHYSLDGNGIAPSFRLGALPNSERRSVWVANNHWVPTQNFDVPNANDSASDEQTVFVSTGSDPAPRRWLTAIEGFVEGSAPTYPLAPGAIGSHELAQVNLSDTTETWSTALTFGLSQVSSFSTHFDPAGYGTVHTLASIYQTNNEHIDVTFTRTATAEGVVSVDVYSSSILMDRLSFKSIYLDREDQVRMVISNSPDELGVTLLVTRNGYGLDSKSIVGGSTSLVPTQIRLSNATRTVVEPMEWYAIQFSPTQALTTAEREIMVGLSSMYERLDGPPIIGPPGFDADEDIDGRDFLIWQRGFGITERAMREDGDANADGRVDEVDLAAWQLGYGLGGETGSPTADFNQDTIVDGDDLVAWQTGYGITGTANANDQGDSNFDGNVDGRDFLFWQRQFNGGQQDPPPEQNAVEGEDVALVHADGSDPSILQSDSVDVTLQDAVAAATFAADDVAADAEPVVSGLTAEDFWLPVTSLFDDASKRAPLDERVIQELVSLKKFVPPNPRGAQRTTGSETAEWGDKSTEPLAWNDWHLSTDLAFEDWRAF